MSNYHVMPDSEHGWAIRKEGVERNAAFADTQEEAERMAKELAGRSGGGEVVIHAKDGTIRDKDTIPPANDPFPPRDLVR